MRRVQIQGRPNAFGELYLPERLGSHPVVMLLHGGFWRKEYGLDLMRPIAHDLVNHCVIVLNVEYTRWSPGNEGVWSETLDDILTVWRSLGSILDSNVADLKNSGVIGHSAGGTLALWLASVHTLQGRSYRAPKTILAQAAISDLADGMRRGLSDDGDAIHRWLGQVSDAKVVHANPQPEVPWGTEWILAHGLNDKDVPYEMSANFVAAATGRNRPILFPLPSCDHYDIINPETRAWSAQRDSFLRSLRR